MIPLERSPAVTGALIKRDCFLLSWNCSWLLFESQHCIRLARLATMQIQRGFITIQLMAFVSERELLLSKLYALQYPRCGSYCHRTIQLKRSCTPTWTNDDALCLLFTSAELKKLLLSHLVINMSQPGCYDKSLSLSGYYRTSRYSIPLHLIFTSQSTRLCLLYPASKEINPSWQQKVVWWF